MVAMRALVMLMVLVGLPAAWVYYGPLPPAAQRVVNRLVELGRTAVAGESDPSPPQLRALPAASATPPVHLTSATASATAAPPRVVEAETWSDQLEPHLSALRQWGADEYTLEHWGAKDELVRFSCAISMGGGGAWTRQFEAVAADPQAAVRQVVGEVSAWQNARGGATRWR